VNQVAMAAVLMSQQRIRWKNTGGKSGLAGWRWCWRRSVCSKQRDRGWGLLAHTPGRSKATYHTPHAVNIAINAVLRVFNLSVASDGGIQMFSQRIIEKHGDWPGGCSHATKPRMQ